MYKIFKKVSLKCSGLISEYPYPRNGLVIVRVSYLGLVYYHKSALVITEVN